VSPQWAINVMQILELARESSARRTTIPYLRVSAGPDSEESLPAVRTAKTSGATNS